MEESYFKLHYLPSSGACRTSCIFRLFRRICQICRSHRRIPDRFYLPYYNRRTYHRPFSAKPYLSCYRSDRRNRCPLLIRYILALISNGAVFYCRVSYWRHSVSGRRFCKNYSDCHSRSGALETSKCRNFLKRAAPTGQPSDCRQSPRFTPGLFYCSYQHFNDSSGFYQEKFPTYQL